VRFAGELLHQLVPPSKPLADAKAEQNRINQQKAVFRVFVDSVLAGIISTGIACAMIPSIIGASKNATKTEIKLKEWFERDGGIILWLINSLIKGDLSEHSNCHFVILLVKSYNELLSSSDAAVESSSDLIDKAVQEALTALLKDYADSVFSRLVKEHSTLQKMRKHNQEHLITRGELSDQQKAKFEAAERSFTSILQIAEILAESLSMEMPRLSGEEGVFIKV
jgi:hypothetical protein